MTVREKMMDFRRNFGLSRKDMAVLSCCSEGLLAGVERGDVTHPIIAHRIGEAYGLTEIETEELMPLCKRIHGGNYEPDKYVALVDRDPSPIPRSLPLTKEAYVV